MKKEFNFNYKNKTFLLEDVTNKDQTASTMSIDIKKLEFNTQSYYQLFFEDVYEKIEITIKNNVNENEIEDAEMQKAYKYIYSTIDDLTQELCEKINNECFSLDKN